MMTRDRTSALVSAALAAALFVLLGLQALSERSFERRWPRRRYEELLYLPSGRHLEVMALGFRSFYADVLWVKAIGYFGGHTLTDRQYPWFYHILDQTTTLDPQFRYPYVFGGIALAVAADRAEESVQILRKGMLHYPGDWHFPFYIGFDYFYFLRDPERAAVYMRYAASLAGSPAYLPRLAASLTAESGRADAAILFLEQMAEGSRDESVRRDIQAKIADLRADRLPESLRQFLAGKRAP
jgi:hypothetical protein